MSLLAAGFSLATSRPAAASDVVAWMVAQNSYKCADDPGYSTAWGTQLDQWDCVSQDNERWDHVPESGGYYELKNVASGLCMNVKGASYSSGASVIQWGCSSSYDNGLWKPKAVNSNGGQEWINKRSGLCLNVAKNSTVDGAWLIQYTCSSSYDNETWNNSGG